MLEKLFVRKLFGIFDNEINFRDGGITVVIGQNGCGKTTMLHILNAVFQRIIASSFNISLIISN